MSSITDDVAVAGASCAVQLGSSEVTPIAFIREGVPPMIVRVALAISLHALMVACGRDGGLPGTESLSPVAPSSASAMADHVSTQRREDVLVHMQDACDPETFNAKSISCVRAGGVTFDDFIAKLTRFGNIGPWRFAPAVAHGQVGQTFVATNIGGETHTFTHVAEFGGGLVPLLNELARVPNVAPECAPEALEPEDFVAPGATYRETIAHGGDLKFQCCIHPWMRLEASIR